MTIDKPSPLPTSFRLPGPQATKLASLAELVGRSKTDVLRWLIIKATSDDLPPGWVAAAEAERALKVTQ